MLIIKSVFYVLISLFLSLGGINASKNWQFWAIMGCVMLIDIISRDQ